MNNLIKSSPYMRRIWQVEEQGNKNLLTVYQQKIIGNININRLSKALYFLIKDTFLSTELLEKNGEIYWKLKENHFVLQCYDVRNLSFQLVEEKQHDFIYAPFDLTQHPCCRFGLYWHEDQVYDFIIVIYGFSLNEYSLRHFLSKLSDCYNIPNLERKEAVNSNYNYLSNILKKLNEHNPDSFWRKYLLDAVEKNDLPRLLEKKSFCENDVEVMFFQFGQENIDKHFDDEKIFHALLSLWGLLIARYGNNNRAVIRCTIDVANNKYLIDTATNYFPVDIYFNDKMTFREMLNNSIDVKKRLIINDSLNYGYYPFDEIMSSAKIENANVGFDQQLQHVKALNLDQLKIEETAFSQVKLADMDLLLEYVVCEKNLAFKLSYSPDRIDKNIVKQLKKSYCYFLSQAFNNIDIIVNEIKSLPLEDYHQVVYAWSKSKEIYPKSKTISQLFEDQVRREPEKNALVFKGEKLTYQQLNQKANQLARYIRSFYQQHFGKSLQPDTLIALCFDRSVEMIVAMLGILKSGGAYTPIDPAYSDERIGYILNDIGGGLVLTQDTYEERLEKLIDDSLFDYPNKKIQSLGLNSSIHQNEINRFTTENLEPYSSPNDLAYVVYTSGTTGKPKGVMIEQNSVLSLFGAIDDLVGDHSSPEFKNLVQLFRRC